MAIFIIILAAASDTMVGMLRQYKQQSKIAETSMEGMMGMEILRQDIESAGYGLPWVIPTGVTYTESTAGLPEAAYDDAATNPPRPILSGNGAGFNGSDVLVVKAANITREDFSRRWTYLTSSGTKTWDVSTQNPNPNDYMIVLSPGASDADRRSLMTAGGAWRTLFSNIASFTPGALQQQPLYVYDFGSSLPPMPFNRADYFIQGSADTTLIPRRCAPNTGELMKAVILNGSRSNIAPLLDCVADMQVVFRLDTDGNGVIDTPTDDISAGYTAQTIRSQLKEVRVYILTHEGQKDKDYRYPDSTVYVGDLSIGGGRYFDLGGNVNYRWKLYTIAVSPKNAR